MPKGTPVERQLTRTINARVLDEHYDYLVAQLDEDTPNMSVALRQSILKAQILDRLLSEGRLPDLVADDDSQIDWEREAREKEAVSTDREVAPEGRD